MNGMKYGNALGVKELLILGHPITKLEAISLFGISCLTTIISDMRKSGHIIKSRKITMAEAVRNLNKSAHFSPPNNLPIGEITMTQYWIET